MLRDETRTHFASILESEPIFQCLSSQMKTSLVNRLESSCHNANIDYCKTHHIPAFWDDENFVEHYSSNIYRVSINLDHTSSINVGNTVPFNRILMSSILLTALIEDARSTFGQIKNQQKFKDRLGLDVKQIGYMTSLDLNSYSSQNYLDLLAIRADQQIEVKTTKMYLCPQCHKRNATFYQLQTRSGDEGYTTFIQCQICEHRWTLR